MCKIVGIGACVMDTLVTVPHYPTEDTKLRASGTKLAGGGPTATGLVAASKLGEDVGYIGVLSNDSSGHFLLSDFVKYGVDVDNVDLIDGHRAFTSVIWLSTESASRTCVFDKGDLPPLKLNEAQRKAVCDADVLMVDGNEMDAALEAARLARENNVKVLYDCGGLYENVDKLLALTDIMIPSAEFALGHTGCNSATEAAKKLYATYKPEYVVVTMGKDGGLLFDGEDITYYPIYPVEVADSNGSGDVFHGAFAAGIIKGFEPLKCCHFSSAVSALKCTGVGARESVPGFETVKEFLKENGYEL